MCIRDSDKDIANRFQGPKEFADELIIATEFNAAPNARSSDCLLYTSDAADERSSVDLGGRRIIKKKNRRQLGGACDDINNQQTTEHKYEMLYKKQ